MRFSFYVTGMDVFFWLIRSSFTLIVVAGVCLVAVTVPLGRRTLLEHTVAILTTQPAKELGEDLAATGNRIKTGLLGAVEEVEVAGED